MKRILAIALTVLAVLCLVSALAEAPDEATAVEFYHKVFTANHLDTLFSRHESLSYAFTYPLDPEGAWSVWETRDSIYREFGTNTAEFERDRIVYNMYQDAETGALDISSGINADADYDPLYSFVRKTEEEFYDTEHDHATQIDEVDGMLHIASEYDETLSRQFLENELNMEYTGQTIRTELFLDAETYELRKSVDTMLQDGEETIVCVVDAEYDTPEPLASRVLRSSFERASKNMMTVTFVVDPGTDHEIRREVTVPANTEAGSVFCEAPTVYFDDADCETLTHWDRMSDRTFYFFTNPDEALTEKFQTLYDEVIQGMQSTEPDTATFEALVSANSAEAVFSRHANFTRVGSYFQDGAETCSEYDYMDADTFISILNDGRATLISPDLNVIRDKDDQDFYYLGSIYDTPDGCASVFEDWKNVPLVIIPETERLLETRDAGDGLFVAVTENSDPDVVRKQLNDFDFLGDYEYAEGMRLRYEYTFHKETCDLLTLDVWLVDAEGAASTFAQTAYAYDMEVYDPAAEGEIFAEYLAALEDPEQSRTFTIVFEPDTENERAVECTLPNSTRFSVTHNGDPVEQLYTDRECTQVFEGSDGVADMTLYAR